LPWFNFIASLCYEWHFCAIAFREKTYPKQYEKRVERGKSLKVTGTSLSKRSYVHEY
jgi:hypothetical protein